MLNTTSRLNSRAAFAAWSLAVLLLLALATACVEDDQTGTPLVGEVLLEGLSGPTQLVIGPDGHWWVALIGGGENDGQGQVVRIDPANLDQAPLVVLDRLDKPTGVALFADELWVMERDRLTRGPLDGSTRTVVVDNLPTNGRSEGSLTVDGDQLLYDTSGSLQIDGTPVPDSGVLWSVDGEGQVSMLATGFKHAYAQVRLSDATLLSTEVSDGRYDGNRPDDEIVAVVDGADHGWPRCIGDNVLVVEYGGTSDICDAAPPSYALFPPGATPTSVVVAPWNPDELLVALWNEGRVVSIPVEVPSTGSPSTEREAERSGYSAVYAGSANPQHLTVDGIRVLLTDHLDGRIVALTPAR